MASGYLSIIAKSGSEFISRISDSSFWTFSMILSSSKFKISGLSTPPTNALSKTPSSGARPSNLLLLYEQAIILLSSVSGTTNPKPFKS